MKKRIFTNWTLIRVLFLAMGIFVIIESIVSQNWLGILFGGYFASMGLFAIGCVGGNCFGGDCYIEPSKKSFDSSDEIEFEEIK